MAKFRCARCKEEYEDYYPPDDSCLICKGGTVRIVLEPASNNEKEI